MRKAKLYKERMGNFRIHVKVRGRRKAWFSKIKIAQKRLLSDLN